MSKSVNMYMYNEFYKKNKRSIYNFIYKMIHEKETAEELVDDVFVKAYLAMHQFDEGKSSFKTWVYNIAQNATIDYLRKKKLNTMSFHAPIFTNEDESTTMETYGIASNEDDPLAVLEKKEMRKQIEAALKQLPDDQAEVLSQFMVGVPYEEIADDLNMPLGTVKGKLFHARNNMREIMKRKPVEV